MRCEAVRSWLGSQLRQHGARPTALLRRNRRACRRNGKRGEGQRFPHGCPPSRPQSLWLLHGAESNARVALCVCENPRFRCTYTSRTLQSPVKDPRAGPKPRHILSLLALLSEPRGTASRSRAALDKLIEEALASHVALPSRISLLITLWLPIPAAPWTKYRPRPR